MTDTNNVFPFARPQPKSPDVTTFRFIEMRLIEGCGLEMTLYDQEENVAAVLTYALTDRPNDFALDALREAWNHWRGTSTVAS